MSKLLLFMESWKMFTKENPWEMKSIADMSENIAASHSWDFSLVSAELVSVGCWISTSRPTSR